MAIGSKRITEVRPTRTADGVAFSADVEGFIFGVIVAHLYLTDRASRGRPVSRLSYG